MAAAGRTCTCCGATTTSSLLPTPHCPNCRRAGEGSQAAGRSGLHCIARLTISACATEDNQVALHSGCLCCSSSPALPCPPQPPTSPPTLFHPEAYSRPSWSAASVCRQPPATRATFDTAATRLGMYTSLQGGCGGGEEERSFVQFWGRPRSCRQPADNTVQVAAALESQKIPSTRLQQLLQSMRSHPHTRPPHLRSPCMSCAQAPQPQVYMSPLSSTAMLQSEERSVTGHVTPKASTRHTWPCRGSPA